MKTDDLLLAGVALLALYVVTRPGVAKVASSAASSMRSSVTEILDTSGKGFDNGWRYFSDGTAIDPSGNYYLKGQQIWSPQ